MKTAEFFQFIESHPRKLLRFRDHQNQVVHPSYHVSEVKTASLATVDCGGMEHHWNETILQLWLSADPEAERAMVVGKATEILTQVSHCIHLDPDAELRIEYGNDRFPPVLFHIARIEIETEAVVVSLRPPVLECKLEERGGSCARPQTKEEAAASCCGGGKTTDCQS